MTSTDNNKVLSTILRVALGFIFLWAFLDKVFGLGFSTSPDKSWLAGSSPTQGFLAYGTSGPFVELYKILAGNMFVDWLYMIGLVCVGLALLLGIGVRIAGYSGAVMMILIWSAALFPEHNPFIDEHIIYALVLVWFARTDVTKQIGLGQWWQNLLFVQKHPILK